MASAFGQVSPGSARTANRPAADAQAIIAHTFFGLAAGGLAGMLVGGIGGRIAMYLLRLTSDASVKGIESDDGFVIGRFTAGGTFDLFVACAVMGSLTGIIVMAGRPFLPRRGMVAAWGAAGAITGGALFVHADGVDFTLLEPAWLAIALFMVLPAAGAALLVWLVELMAPWWFRDWRRTAPALLPAIPGTILFVGPLAAVCAAIWWVAMRAQGARDFPQRPSARILAIVVFALVVALGAVALTGDVVAIL